MIRGVVWISFMSTCLYQTHNSSNQKFLKIAPNYTVIVRGYYVLKCFELL